MNNNFGTSSIVRETTYKYNKAPHYQDTYTGTQADVSFSGSIYYNNGWEVKYTPGNPWVMTATIDADINGSGQPVTTGSAYVTTTWGFHFNTCEKELLHTSVNGLNNGNGAWLNNINNNDKNVLEYYIANPPTITGSLGMSMPTTMSWDTSHGFSSNSTSITAAQVVWAMTKNGAKTIPVIVPVLTMNMTVPNGYNMNYFTSYINRVHSKSTVGSQLNVPTSVYNIMWQDSDPATGTVTTDIGTNIPLIYGWLKQPPTIDQSGLNFTIRQDWVYGLYYQNIYGTRI